MYKWMNITDAQVAEIKAGKEKLMESAQKLFAKMYEQAGSRCTGSTGQHREQVLSRTRVQEPAPDGFQGDDVVDGDYKEV